VSFSVTLAASSGKTIPFDEVNQRLETVLQELFGGTIEATSKSLMRVRVPISQLEAMADQVNGIAFMAISTNMAEWSSVKAMMNRLVIRKREAHVLDRKTPVYDFHQGEDIH
jgi:hypothetical protein